MSRSAHPAAASALGPGTSGKPPPCPTRKPRSPSGPPSGPGPSGSGQRPGGSSNAFGRPRAPAPCRAAPRYRGKWRGVGAGGATAPVRPLIGASAAHPGSESAPRACRGPAGAAARQYVPRGVRREPARTPLVACAASPRAAMAIRAQGPAPPGCSPSSVLSGMMAGLAPLPYPPPPTPSPQRSRCGRRLRARALSSGEASRGGALPGGDGLPALPSAGCRSGRGQRSESALDHGAD